MSMSASRLSSTASTSTSRSSLLGAPHAACRASTRRGPPAIVAFLAGFPRAWSKVLQRSLPKDLGGAKVKVLDRAEPAHVSPSTHKKQLRFSWAGSGLYFFWQLGAMQYLSEHYDLTKLPMVGASGGSIAATLAACRVPADVALARAYELSHKYGVWDRPQSIVGVLSALVEEWLHSLLPDNAHELCRGRVTVVVTTLPDLQQIGISDFRDKQDLIDAIMASSHVPFVLDLKSTRTCRGRECVDGSLPDFFYGNCDLLTHKGEAIVFDYFYDTNLKRSGRMDMLKLTSYEDMKERIQIGYAYAQRLHTSGEWDGYHIGDEVLASGRGMAGMTGDTAVPIPASTPSSPWPKPCSIELASLSA
ncbi:hypothetical protein FOA52_016138 [Chlamydomonas sp. UWO 241]|nr:hypothetical protein FOA52_016138 [Chlamydomonas sp. UWO 241]